MFLLFLVTWIIFNGKATGEIVSVGFMVATLVFAFMCKFMGYSMNKEKNFYKKLLFLIGYAFLLVKEIIVANMAVMQMIWTRKEIMEPVIVQFQANLKTELARVILANSITLTPGTITVALEENMYTVHCLDKSLAEDIENSVFVKMLEEMERKG